MGSHIERDRLAAETVRPRTETPHSRKCLNSRPPAGPGESGLQLPHFLERLSPEMGRLRGYLLTAARNHLLHHTSARAPPGAEQASRRSSWTSSWRSGSPPRTRGARTRPSSGSGE
jgi:hypothetical protein